MPALSLILCLFLALVTLVLYAELRRLRKTGQGHTLQSEFEKSRRELIGELHTQTLEQSRLLQNGQLAHQHSFGSLEHRLGELQQVSEQILASAREMTSLRALFQSPKLRGNLGELLLTDLLRQVLPASSFSLQYSFDGRQKVDAVIHLAHGMVPVDAKFPLENFERGAQSLDEREKKNARKQFVQDVKKHIDDISAKYIRTAEGTLEFALMYIPSESVYYETMVLGTGDDDLVRYGQERKVLAVSPSSFFVYLETILRGLKGLRIERAAQTLLENLGKLEQDLKRFTAEFEKLGGHLRLAVGVYEKTQAQADALRRSVGGLTLPQTQDSSAASPSHLAAAQPAPVS